MKLRRHLTPLLIVRVLCFGGAATIGLILLLSKKPWEILAEVGTPTKLKHLVPVYEWWAAAFNTLLLLVLGGTARWWITTPPGQSAPSSACPPSPKWFWPLVALAMLTTAVLGTQRLNHSLWDDEEAAMRRAIAGKFRPDKSGEVRMDFVSWQETLWHYKLPTNHHLQSILSRISLDAWRTLTRPEGLQFSEPVTRFPGYLAGILSVGALALWVYKMGFPRAAVAAAFLLALHPWHIRYATEQRGYIFVLLLVPVLLFLLLKILESGRWRCWLAFGACGFGLMYAYPACVYFLATANLMLLAALVAREGFSQNGRIQIGRFLVANTLAAMVFLQLFLPCVPQLLTYLHTQTSQGVLGPRWHRNLGAHFLTGLPWNNSDAPTGGYPELQWLAEAHPVLFPSLVAAAVLFVGLGVIRLAVVRGLGWVLLPILLLPGLFVYLQARSQGQYLYEWYLIFTLPGVIALFAIGLDGIAALGQRIRPGPVLPLAFLTAAVAVFALATHAPRHRILSTSIQPMRESVLLTRPTLNPHDPRQNDILTGGFNSFPAVYDVHVIALESPETVRNIARLADATGRPFFVNYGNQLAARVDNPDLTSLVEDDRYFEKIATLPGFDPTLTRFVRRYRSGSLSPGPE